MAIELFGELTMFLEQPAAEMDISNTRQAPFIERQVPLGLYFSRDDGWWPGIRLGIARFWSRPLRRKAALERNIDPRQADSLLDEWESAYDLPLGESFDLQDRRDAVLAKVRSVGGVNAEALEAIAADFGYPDAVVTDAADPLTTLSFSDDFLLGGEWQLTLLLTAASQGATRDDLLKELISQSLLAGWFAIYEFT
jgi:hypothetical protein